MRRLRQLTSAARGGLALLALILSCASCTRRESPAQFEFAGEVMGTTWSVQVVEPPSDLELEELASSVAAVFRDVDRSMSTFRADSEVSGFNDSPSLEWQALSPATVAVLEESLRIGRLSGGALDVTLGPLVELWGFGPRPSVRVPSAAEIEAARARIGLQHIALRAQPPGARKARPDLAVDLSSIAKGHAVDRVAALLESEGVGRFLVELGGELRAAGANASGQAWAVAVEPVAGMRSPSRTLLLQDASAATSGDGGNWFVKDGRRYSHVIDPRTGRPVQHSLASVTVIHRYAMTADALATALFVLGPEEGLALARQENLAVLFRDRKGDTLVDSETPELRAILRESLSATESDPASAKGGVLMLFASGGLFFVLSAVALIHRLRSSACEEREPGACGSCDRSR